MCNDISSIRKDFPVFQNRPDLIYLDNAATTQKPFCVIQKEQEFYEKNNANPFRGIYKLGEDATEEYENARITVQKFIHAEMPEEIIFTRNATESLNLVAYSLSALMLKPGDEILISIMEHHSNLIPWQQAAARTGAVLKYIECTKEDPSITEDQLRNAMTPRTKIVAITQISNVLGCTNNIRKLAETVHEKGAVFVADGAQSVPHIPVNVMDLNVDFLVFSGHKMLAPMGIGVLYGKKKLLDKMPPFLCGGEMIDSVSRDGAVYAPVPHKFEAGTVNAGGAAALAEAIRYYEQIGFENIQKQEALLTEIAVDGIKKLPFIHILGSQNPREHQGIISFVIDGVHPHDVAAILDADHIAVRAGHHCAQPLLKYYGVSSSTRVSFSFYNTEKEVSQLLRSLKEIRRKMGYAE
jgi:cysteine desulfurase/selenocysteine lyase